MTDRNLGSRRGAVQLVADRVSGKQVVDCTRAQYLVSDYHLETDILRHCYGFPIFHDAEELPDHPHADVPHLPALDDPHFAYPWGMSQHPADRVNVPEHRRKPA